MPDPKPAESLKHSLAKVSAMPKSEFFESIKQGLLEAIAYKEGKCPPGARVYTVSVEDAKRRLSNGKYNGKPAAKKVSKARQPSSSRTPQKATLRASARLRRAG